MRTQIAIFLIVTSCLSTIPSSAAANCLTDALRRLVPRREPVPLNQQYPEIENLTRLYRDMAPDMVSRWKSQGFSDRQIRDLLRTRDWQIQAPLIRGRSFDEVAEIYPDLRNVPADKREQVLAAINKLTDAGATRTVVNRTINVFTRD